jgi:tripartite-type tricarboxylate transporter receptor subunit TctC
MAEIGAEPVGNSSAEMAQQIAADTARYAKLVKAAKVSLD